MKALKQLIRRRNLRSSSSAHGIPSTLPSSVSSIPSGRNAPASNADLSNPVLSQSMASEPESSSPHYLGLLKSGLILLLNRVESILDGTAFKIPISVVNTVVDLASRVSNNNDRFRVLFQEITHQLDIVNAVLPKTSTAEGRDRIFQFSQSLKIELDILETIAGRSTVNQLIESDEDISTIEATMRRIDGGLRAFHLDITMSIERKIDTANIDAALRILYSASASDATHDAADGDTHPPCHPNTRMETLERLRKWSQDDNSSQILWMHGPAGTGKSAIAQSFCEELQTWNCLAGSFFFRRGHPSRGNATKLWPTIAYQLALLLPGFKTALGLRLTTDPSLLDKSIAVQLQRLVIDSYAEASSSRSLVIVVDGLDECEGETRQQDILRSIGGSVDSQPLLRVLIVSRPEAHIKDIFCEPPLQPCEQLNILGSMEDVCVYLVDEFKRIRKTHSMMATTSYAWPEDHLIQHLVTKSSGHFIYAATVIRFVEDKDFDPVERLAIVAQLPSNYDDLSPFAELDQLYLQILNMAPHRSKLSRILSVIAAGFTSGMNVDNTGELLGLKPPEILLTLRRLHSLISIEDRPLDWATGPMVPSRDTPTEKIISVYHASFLDFLHDSSRSQSFCFTDLNRQNLAVDMLTCLATPSEHDDTEPSSFFPLQLIQHLPFLSTTKLTPQVANLLHSMSFEWIDSFHILRQETQDLRRWLEQQQAPAHLLDRWDNYCSMAALQKNCSFATQGRLPMPHAASKPLNTKITLNYIRSVTSSQQIRVIQLYFLACLPLTPSSWRSSCLAGTRVILGLSWKEIQSIIAGLPSAPADWEPEADQEEYGWKEAFIRSVSHPTRMRILHPDPTLESTALWCLNNMGRRPRIWRWFPPAWSCILRSCPPSSDLLHVLRAVQGEISSFILAELEVQELSPASNRWHDILQWLQTFSEPPLDMIEHVRSHLPVDYVGDDNIWLLWKEFTGW
ncbi:hypothetical protein R3P38DRAFT_3004421 [Favolaschia claudopus]|uniref:Nephrocystin 3-like N-terminal domain-containing protein n=1 Tax=Favolaschia claudopus TaxID=2862362 RepID=A0AAW0ALQ7_9AGAR